MDENSLKMIGNEFGVASLKHFDKIIKSIQNGKLIDIGVYMGASSKLMIDSCIENNNIIYGIWLCVAKEDLIWRIMIIPFYTLQI
jgi:uncharacterized ferredoxin-like protein